MVFRQVKSQVDDGDHAVKSRFDLFQPLTEEAHILFLEMPFQSFAETSLEGPIRLLVGYKEVFYVSKYLLAVFENTSQISLYSFGTAIIRVSKDLFDL
jgi:hypothetical protein